MDWTKMKENNNNKNKINNNEMHRYTTQFIKMNFAIANIK